MQVQVSLIIEIEASASLTQMEQQIQEAGQQAMRQALKQAIRQQEDHQTSCPRCGGKQRRLEGTVRRAIATTFGRVQIPRRRFRCHGCWHRWCPANSLWSRAEGRNGQPTLARSGHAGRSILALSRGEQSAQAAEWSRDQCGRDPEARQPGRQAAGGAKAGRRQSEHAPRRPRKAHQQSRQSSRCWWD